MSGLVNDVGTVLCPLEGKKSPTLGSIPKVISKWVKSYINKTIKILGYFYFGVKKGLFKKNLSLLVSHINTVSQVKRQKGGGY